MHVRRLCSSWTLEQLAAVDRLHGVPAFPDSNLPVPDKGRLLSGVSWLHRRHRKMLQRAAVQSKHLQLSADDASWVHARVLFGARVGGGGRGGVMLGVRGKGWKGLRNTVDSWFLN